MQGARGQLLLLFPIMSKLYLQHKVDFAGRVCFDHETIYGIKVAYAGWPIVL